MSWGNRKYHFSEHVSQILLDQCSSKRQDDRVKEAGSHCIVLEDPLVRFLQKFGKYKIIVCKVLINDKRVQWREEQPLRPKCIRVTEGAIVPNCWDLLSNCFEKYGKLTEGALNLGYGAISSMDPSKLEGTF